MGTRRWGAGAVGVAAWFALGAQLLWSTGLQLVDAGALGECNSSLGMSSGDIRDEDISASSTHNAGSVGAPYGRLHREVNGGAWCPAKQIDQEVYEWLEVNLQRYYVVRGIGIQGRFGNGQGREYAEHFIIEYWRSGINKWVRYYNRSGKHIFEGNSNTYTAEFRQLDPYIVTDRIRIVPYSQDTRTVCMRIELYGCRWTQGIVSYTIPMGERFNSNTDLSDKFYDGGRDDSILHDGLGLLTDGIEGPDNIKTFDYGLVGIPLNARGLHEWVGWRNDSVHANPLEIVFEFDVVRNFSAAYFHCNNQHSKDVSLFGTAKFWFSIGGRWYIDEPLVFKNMHNPLNEKARNVTIRLHGRVGRFVRVQLSYRSRWILLSEVAFSSTPAVGNFTEEEEPVIPQVVLPTVIEDPVSQHQVGVLIGALAAVILLLALVIFVIVLRQRQRKQSTPLTTLKPMAANGTISDSNRITINMKDLALQYQPKFALNGNIYGQVNLDDPDKLLYQEPSDFKSPLYPTTYSNVVFLADSSSREYAVPQDIATPRSPKTLNRNAAAAAAAAGGGGGAMVVGSPPNFVRPLAKSSQQPVTTALHQPLSPQQHHHHQQQLQLLQQQQQHQQQLHQQPLLHNGGSPLNHHYYAATDVVASAPSIQGVSGTTVYSVPSVDLSSTSSANSTLSAEETTTCSPTASAPAATAPAAAAAAARTAALATQVVRELPRGRVRLLERIGEGQFGEVHLAETDGLPELIDVPCSFGSKCLVAVKSLRRNASDLVRKEFYREVKILSRVRDPNIAHILGVCTRDEPLAMVMEYSEHGDLNEFLNDHLPDTFAPAGGTTKTLSHGTLIYMATQIASGMKYLESLNFVHRDLAARNCLVGAGFVVKISDFAMSRPEYRTDYCRAPGGGGRGLLPVRWAPWEVVLFGRFSTKSDVWAFAVTLWEMLTFARQRPFANCSDDAVIENARLLCSAGDGRPTQLAQPPDCPKEIFDMMRECWQRNEADRPNFKEIHLFLQRKNLGYAPQA